MDEDIFSLMGYGRRSEDYPRRESFHSTLGDRKDLVWLLLLLRTYTYAPDEDESSPIFRFITFLNFELFIFVPDVNCQKGKSLMVKGLEKNYFHPSSTFGSSSLCRLLSVEGLNII